MRMESGAGSLEHRGLLENLAAIHVLPMLEKNSYSTLCAIIARTFDSLSLFVSMRMVLLDCPGVIFWMGFGIGRPFTLDEIEGKLRM